MLPLDGEGMYRTFLAEAQVVNPNLRLIGLTATPYRMTTGMICGPENLLNHVCYEVGVRELIVQGYFSPLKTKAGRQKADTSALHIRGGEFLAGEVEALMDNDSLVRSACAEIVEQTADRHSVLIFAAGVQHALHVQRVLGELCCECGFVCGETLPFDRAETLRRFRDGELKYLVNVNVLTTGFDAPNIDCVALLRPTNSPGLYYQMVGRGFRLHPSKGDCLVLDFGGNILRHGPVDALQIQDRAGGAGEAPAKECPECQAVIHAAYAVCPECGYEFPPPQREQHDREATTAGILSGEVTETEHEVTEVYYSVHVKRGAPEDHPRSMRVDYRCGFNDYHSEWVCFEHDGYARQKAEAWWRARSHEPVPEIVEQAVDVCEAGRAAWSRMADHLVKTHFVSVQQLRAAGCRPSFLLSIRPGRDLPAARRAVWSRALRRAFVDDGEALSALSGKDIALLTRSLGYLGAKDASDAVAKWINAGEHWHSAAPNELVWAVKQLSKATTAGDRQLRRAARSQVAAHVGSKYASGPDDARQLTPAQWAGLAGGLRDVMSAEDRALWAGVIRQVFGGRDQTLAGVEAGQRDALIQAIASLDGSIKAGLATAWLKDKGGWGGLSVRSLAALALAAHRDDAKKAAPILKALDVHWQARHAAQPLSWKECIALRKAWLLMRNTGAARQWVLRGLATELGTEAARNASNQDKLVAISLGLNDTGLSGTGRAYTQYAATMALLTSRGKLNARKLWMPESLAEPLGTPETRQTVRDALLDAEGNPRLTVAKILTCAYKRYKEFAAWQTYVHGQVSSAPDRSDRKALWLLVKSYTDTKAPRRLDLRRSRPGINMALAHASSEAVRLIALRELASLYADLHRPSVGADVLASVKHQYRGGGLATVESLIRDLRAQEAARQTRIARLDEAAATSRRAAMLAYYRERLLRCQANNEPKEVARLQTAIEKLEAVPAP